MAAETASDGPSEGHLDTAPPDARAVREGRQTAVEGGERPMRLVAEDVPAEIAAADDATAQPGMGVGVADAKPAAPNRERPLEGPARERPVAAGTALPLSAEPEAAKRPQAPGAQVQGVVPVPLGAAGLPAAQVPLTSGASAGSQAVAAITGMVDAGPAGSVETATTASVGPKEAQVAFAAGAPGLAEGLRQAGGLRAAAQGSRGSTGTPEGAAERVPAGRAAAMPTAPEQPTPGPLAGPLWWSASGLDHTGAMAWRGAAQEILGPLASAEPGLSAELALGTFRAETSGPSQPSATPVPQPPPAPLPSQLAMAARGLAEGPVEITLSPAELGRVTLTLSGADGTMVVTVLAERSDTLDLLRRSIGQLAEELRALGYDNPGFSFQQEQRDAERPRGTSAGNRLVLADAAPETAPGATALGRLDLRL